MFCKSGRVTFLPQTFEKACVHSSGSLALLVGLFLYFKVECLYRVVCRSEGVTKLVVTFPGPGPLQGDKWSLFLPSHAFWLMLNPFGLIILIAVPAIKTTDAFVQVRGLQNVTERFWKQQSTFLKVDLWLIVAPPPSLLHPPPSQIAAEGRGTPPCRPGFSEDEYKVVLPDITEKGQPLFNGEWWNFSTSALCSLVVMSASSVCVRLSVSRASWLCVCYMSGRIRTSLAYLSN